MIWVPNPITRPITHWVGVGLGRVGSRVRVGSERSRPEEAGTGRTARNRPWRQLRSPGGPATRQAGAQSAHRVQEGGERDASTSPYGPDRAGKFLYGRKVPGIQTAQCRCEAGEYCRLRVNMDAEKRLARFLSHFTGP
jgi:hypothetical protein